MLWDVSSGSLFPNATYTLESVVLIKNEVYNNKR